MDSLLEAIDGLASLGTDGRADLRAIEPFGPATREPGQSVIHNDYGCGAGTLVCSVSLSGDVNPCSFLGLSYATVNLRDASLAEIWHASQGFRDPGFARRG